MIKTQDLKLQMDELTKQNDMVLIELESVKKMLLSSAQGSQGSQGSQDQSRGSNNSDAGQDTSANQMSSQNQTQGQDQSQGQGQQQQTQNDSQNQDQNHAQNQNQKSAQGNSNNQQVTDLANELLKIKDLVVKLEQKTSQYVSSQSNGSLTEKDAVNLILTLMNGMVDWASEFVSSKASSNGQVQ